MKIETTFSKPRKVETKKYTWNDVKGTPGLYTLICGLGRADDSIFVSLVGRGGGVVLICRGFDIQVANDKTWQGDLFIKSEQSLTLKLENWDEYIVQD